MKKLLMLVLIAVVVTGFSYAESNTVKLQNVSKSVTRPPGMVQLTDLEIKDIGFRKIARTRDGYITAIIKNNGKEFHGNVFYSIELLHAPGASSKRVYSAARLDLIKGREVTVDVWKIDPELFKVSGRKVKIMVDNKRLIPEFNERNNLKEKMVKVADLALQSIDFSFEKKKYQNVWHCKYGIYVIGDNYNPVVRIRQIRVAYRLDNLSAGRNGAWKYITITSNGIAGNKFIGFSVNRPPEGQTNNYKIWVKVDPENVHPETNERNNNEVYRFSVEHFTPSR